MLGAVILVLGFVSLGYGQTPSVRLTEIASGIAAPTDIQNAADGSGRLFLVEQGGLIRIFRNGAVEGQPFLDIRNRTAASGERGLLGLAFPPQFSSRRRFYVNYTNLAGDTVIAMYQLSANPDVANAASEQILLTINQPYANHNGGALRFGPDGFLYIGMGDGGSSGDPQKYAQNRQSLLGKMLRLDVESQPGTVRIPPDNPFVNSGTTRAETWALGLRNPWRFSFDRLSGDLFIGDVGQNAAEEINYQPAASRGGENYGWNITEGLQCFGGGTCNTSGLTPPVTTYPNPSEGCSVTGGFVYRGTAISSLQGAYLYGDYCNGRIRTLRRTGANWVSQPLLESGLNITTFGEDEGGEIYVGDAGRNRVLRLENAGPAKVDFTISSSPIGQRFTLNQDPLVYTAPRTFSVDTASTLSVSWQQQPPAGGVRVLFTGWADGSTANPRQFVAGSEAATYTGNFTTQYLLSTLFTTGGSVVVSPAAADGYYTAGTNVQATASPATGFRFSGYSGCATVTAALANFAMNAPCTLGAAFTADTQPPPPPPPAGSGLLFVPIVPCRAMDTRSAAFTGLFGPPAILGGTRRDVPLRQSVCGIPATARAYSLNITVVPLGPLGFLTIWPSDQARPLASTLNSPNGQVVANATLVPASAGGEVSLFVTDGSHVILDLNGYFVESN